MEKELLIEFRHKLHKQPRLGFDENDVCEAVLLFLHDYIGRFKVIRFAKTAMALVFNPSKAEGPTILFRADMDSLPIQEASSSLPWKSEVSGVASLCGHDGHTTILCGLALKLCKEEEEKEKEQHLTTKTTATASRIVLLFQPAEERGEGAHAIVIDPIWKNELHPDYCFGLHNLPSFDEGSIVIKKGVFASSSRGMEVNFYGKTSHASHPEEGISPALALTNSINSLLALPTQCKPFENALLVTIVHASLGIENAFGVNPGHAKLQATLRAHQETDMIQLVEKSKQLIDGISISFGCNSTISFCDDFPSLVNDSETADIVEKASKTIGLNVIQLSNPMPWSEDFAWVAQSCAHSCFFGLGAGLSSKPLHSEWFDFNDKIISTGVDIFYQIAKQLKNK